MIGLVGNSQSRAETQYCNSLAGLEGAIAEVTSFNPSTGSSGELQADISDVQGAWGDVKSDASQLSDVNQQSLDNAWDQFESAVKDLNNGGSTADVQNAAKGLDSAVQSNADTYDCGLASSTTTTSCLIVSPGRRSSRSALPGAQKSSDPVEERVGEERAGWR